VSRASLTLGATGQLLTLRIQDEGAGFDPEGMRGQPSLGLSSMAERIHLIQGKFTITSAPGRGTTIEVSVPLAGLDQ